MRLASVFSQRPGMERGVVTATILVCTSCKSESEAAGARLADAVEAGLAANGSGARLLRVNCLANCTRGPSAVIRAEGSWSYIFGSLSPDHSASLIAGAALLKDSIDGLLPWRGRPDCLKRGMIARIPPLDFAGDQP